jgi:hypothetical protein
MNQGQIAYCGLDCSACPIHLATLETDVRKQYDMRVAIVHECFVHYGMKIQPDEVNECDGCTAGTGRLFTSCRDCGIRKCAISKGLENCAFCEDFACAELEEMFTSDPSARERLEAIRKI